MIEPKITSVGPQTPPLAALVWAFGECDDDASFFPSDQHLRALEFIGHSLWTRARLGVVTAEQGCGKSLLIRRVLRDLDDRVVAAAVQREHSNPREFLLDILRQFGFALEDSDKTERRKLLERFLNHQAAMGRICVLIVENAQSMHPAVLEELRALASVCVEGARVLKVLMLGQPTLNRVLESPRMVELVAGTVPRFLLGPLSEDQTAAYVAHRLRAAGALNPDALMPYTLLPQIYACSGGVPAQINTLCSTALSAAVDEGARQVTASALDRAIDALGLRERSPRPVPATAKQGDPVAPAVVAPAKLVISMQGMLDREVSLGASRLLIGRGEEADVRIDSVFVSRYHALIVRDKGQDLLLDLGSTNGLLINSRRVVRRAMRHRDIIQVGPARVTYLNEAAMPLAQLDPGETICFARPGFPHAAGDDAADGGTVIAFGRPDTSS